ncbi:MAG: hypothetical protein LW636_05000 [Planctomycetaceae bacterium]|nr:hypothetical protein [Planctomycetaceae bacterium]
MRWWVFLAAVLVAAALDMSMGAVFVVGDLRPRLLPATVVFALLSMPRKGTVRAAMLAGLVADLLSPTVLERGDTLVVLGPNILGFALGATAVVPLRTLLYRRNPLSGVLTTVVFSFLASIAFIAVWALRARLLGTTPPWWPETGGAEAWTRLLGALGDGLLALPVLWLLERTRPLWDFAVGTRLAPGAAREQS